MSGVPKGRGALDEIPSPTPRYEMLREGSNENVGLLAVCLFLVGLVATVIGVWKNGW